MHIYIGTRVIEGLVRLIFQMAIVREITGWKIYGLLTVGFVGNHFLNYYSLLDIDINHSDLGFRI